MMGYSNISHGHGYLLFGGTPHHGILVGLHFKEAKDMAKTYLGELRGICWALHDVQRMVKGRNVVLWSDSESACQRLSRRVIAKKRVLDVRVSRLLARICSKFTDKILSGIDFLQDESAKRQVLLSIFSLSCSPHTNQSAHPTSPSTSPHAFTLHKHFHMHESMVL